MMERALASHRGSIAVTRSLVSIIAVGLLLMAGCTAPPRVTPREQLALRETRWKLESWASDAQDPSKQALYLELGDDSKAKIYSSGQARDAVYDFGGGNDFAFSELPTVVYQSGDEMENQAERIYLDFLSQTRGYRLKNGNLILEDQTQADLMTFVPSK